MIELAVLGWFLAAAINMLCVERDADLAPMSALSAPDMGVPIGCHWEHGRKHMHHYIEGAYHLCNSQCVHQPPEER